LLTTAASANVPSERREVSTSGSCNRTATPDRGQVTMTAQVRDNDLQVAARKANEAYERAVTEVKKLDLENLELRTVEYSLNEVREWEKDRMVSMGFQARIGLRVSTSSIQKLGQVLAIAARLELKDVSGLETYLSPEKKKKEHFACLQEAAEDARSKAAKLAESLGARLGEVLKITESVEEPRPPVRPLMAMARAANEGAPAGPTIEAGQQEIAVTVQASFGLR
jgi:uncharacterized protein YggE